MSVSVRHRGIYVGLVVALLLPGCGASLRETARGMGRSATQGAIEELPKYKGQLKDALRETLLSDDTLKQAAQRATEGALVTLENELQRGALGKQIDQMLSQLLTTLATKGSEATKQLVQTAGPELKEALRQVVIQTVATAGSSLKEAVQKDLADATQVLARKTADALVATLVKALEGPLGEQLQKAAGGMGRQLISEAATSLRDPASKQAVGEFTQSALYGAVRGTKQGVSDGLPDRVQTTLISGVVVLASLLTLTAIALLILFRRYRQSTKSLTIIAQKINQVEAIDLKRAIQKSADDNYVGPWLSNFLKHRGL